MAPCRDALGVRTAHGVVTPGLEILMELAAAAASTRMSSTLTQGQESEGGFRGKSTQRSVPIELFAATPTPPGAREQEQEVAMATVSGGSVAVTSRGWPLGLWVDLMVPVRLGRLCVFPLLEPSTQKRRPFFFSSLLGF